MKNWRSHLWSFTFKKHYKVIITLLPIYGMTITWWLLNIQQYIENEDYKHCGYPHRTKVLYNQWRDMLINIQLLIIHYHVKMTNFNITSTSYKNITFCAIVQISTVWILCYFNASLSNKYVWNIANINFKCLISLRL